MDFLICCQDDGAAFAFEWFDKDGVTVGVVYHKHACVSDVAGLDEFAREIRVDLSCLLSSVVCRMMDICPDEVLPFIRRWKHARVRAVELVGGVKCLSRFGRAEILATLIKVAFGAGGRAWWIGSHLMSRKMRKCR